VGSAPAVTPNGVVVSEFRFRGPNGGNDEFLELRNTSGTPVNISGYKLQGCSSGTGAVADRTTVPEGTTLAAGQTYLFTNRTASGGYSGSEPGDATFSTGFTDLLTTNQSGARIVTAADTVVDGVGSPMSPCGEGGGLTTPTTNADNSFERKPTNGPDRNGQDTDANAADFEGPKVGNPENSSTTMPPPPSEAACSMSGIGNFVDRDDSSEKVRKDDSLSSDLTAPQRLELQFGSASLGNFVTGASQTDRFSMTSATSAVCSDDPAIDPGQGQTLDTITVGGEGTFTPAGSSTAQPGYTVEITIKDGGESGTDSRTQGRGLDSVEGLTVRDPSGAVVKSAGGTLAHGNQDATDEDASPPAS